MKVLTIVMLVVVAGVFAMPAEENSENIVVLSDVDTTDDGAGYINDLVRDKRQYGGNYC